MGDHSREVDLRTCAEEVLWALGAHGVDVLFLNPGTDSAPLQEAAAALAARDVSVPRMVTSSFEAVALAAAHGHFQVSRRPQAVFVHVDVGTQNLGAMVHDIRRDRAGVVVLAGKTPYGEGADDRGGRSNPINWQQDVPDQAGIVRPYAKWVAELTRSEDTPRVIGRAVQVAASDVPGMSYLMLSRDVLMEPAGAPYRRRTTGWARPQPAGLNPGVLREITELLVGADHPLIVTSRVGRRPRGSEALQRLADVAAVPVVGRPEAVNLPTTHPMARRQPDEEAALLAAADVILLVEVDVPWVPARSGPGPSATVVHIDPDPVKPDMPLWSFPVHLAATAEGATALDQLADALVADPRTANAAADRRRTLGRPATAVAPTEGLSPEAVIRALDVVLDAEDIVVEEAVSNAVAVARHLTRTRPGTFCSAGGPGLGWALGASVGAKLAAPDKRVIAVVGDGAFMFGVPTAAFCLAAEAGAQFAAVVLNNSGYRASRLPVLALFPEGVSAATGSVAGTRFASPPDFAGLAAACGAHGERVDDRSQLEGALRRALASLDAGISAVVDVRVDQD